MSVKNERNITNVDENVRHYRCRIRTDGVGLISIGFQARDLKDISYWLGSWGFRDIVHIEIIQYEEEGINIPNPWPFVKIEDIGR